MLGCEVETWIAFETPRCQRARAVGYLLRKATHKEWNQPKRKKYVAVNKEENTGDLKNILTSDMQPQSLEFFQLVFSLVFVQRFLTMIPSLHFVMVMYILCHYMLEVCDFLFFFNFCFTGDYS